MVRYCSNAQMPGAHPEYRAGWRPVKPLVTLFILCWEETQDSNRFLGSIDLVHL